MGEKRQRLPKYPGWNIRPSFWHGLVSGAFAVSFREVYPNLGAHNFGFTTWGKLVNAIAGRLRKLLIGATLHWS